MVNLDSLIPHLPVWILVLFRLTGLFMYAPLFGGLVIPARVKIFLAAGLSFCIYPMLLTPGTASADHLVPVINEGLSLWSLASVISAELGIGLIIGYGSSLPLIALQWAGRSISQQLGLGIAEVFNPGEEQGRMLSQLFFLLALAGFVSLNGHLILFSTLIETFQNIPLGGFGVDQHAINLIVGLLTSMLHVALRIAAPLFCLIFLETIVTGFLMRTVPQMNILSIGFAIKILLGIGLLMVAIGTQTSVLVEIWFSTFANLSQFFSPGSLPSVGMW